jgi:hypothetical protein
VTANPDNPFLDSPTNLNVGQERIEEALDSPYFNTPLVLFGTSRLREVYIEMHFSAHLCLWTNRSGTRKDVAERSYGVLLSFDWHVLGEWKIDNDNNITVVKKLLDSPPISGAFTHVPLLKPDAAKCEIYPPTAEKATVEALS